MGHLGDKRAQENHNPQQAKSRNLFKQLRHKLKGKEDIRADTLATKPVAGVPSHDGIQNTDQANSSKQEDAPEHIPASLWDHAYDALKYTNPELVNKYEKLLSKQLQGIRPDQARSASNGQPGQAKGNPKSFDGQSKDDSKPSESASSSQAGQAKATLKRVDTHIRIDSTSSTSASRNLLSQPKSGQKGVDDQIKNDPTASGSAPCSQIRHAKDNESSPIASGSTSQNQASAPDDFDNAVNHTKHLNISDRRAILTFIAQSGVKRLEDKKIRYHIAGHEFVLQDQITGAIGILDWAKDWIGEAVATSPQASSAWAGVCTILPLLTRPIAAEQANRDGFMYVTARMRYYIALEPLLLPQRRSFGTHLATPDSRCQSNVQEQIEAQILNLYQHILAFEFRSVLRFYGLAFYNFGQDVFNTVDWEALKANIVELENQLRADSAQESSLASRDELAKISLDTIESLKDIQRLISTVQEHLQVGKEQRNIASNQLSVEEEQLQVQKIIAKKMLSQDEEKCHQLFRLNGSDSYEYYKDHVADRVEGTCEWFLNHKSFKEWVKKDRGLLLVSADPGCGKSVLARYLIETDLPRSAIVCYFFFKDQLQNTLKQALCALLHQLFSQRPSLIRHAILPFSDNGSHLINVPSQLWDILQKAAHDAKTGPVIFVLDVLDECVESDFPDLSRMLKQNLQDSETGQVKFLLTSRPYHNITSRFQGLIEDSLLVHVSAEQEVETISEDINLVIEYRAYEKILSKSKNDKKVRLVLSMILAAKRPLSLAEMNVAVHAHSASSYYDMDLEDDEDFRKTLRNWCGLFVKIYDGKVEFLHQTAREFLLRKPSETPGQYCRWQGSMSIAQAHATIAESCVAYLNFPDHDIEVPGDELSRTIATWAFDLAGTRPYFHYSACFWPLHFRLAQSPEGAVLIPSVLRLCAASEERKSEIWLLVYRWWQGNGPWRLREHCSKLHLASYLGLNKIVEVLLQESMDANAVDNLGDTPLTLAAENGDNRVINLLISHGADPNKANDKGDTALVKAAKYGYTEVAKLLLDNGVDPNKTNNEGNTALSEAAYFNHVHIVKMLLDNSADPNIANSEGGTALLKAAIHCRIEVIELLLDSGADPSKSNDKGQTALSWAAERGSVNIAKLLLDAGASPHGNNIRPMHSAIISHRVDIVRLLLDSGLDVNDRDSKGYTSLHYAANRGKVEIVNILMERGADVNAVNDYGETPLHCAASWQDQPGVIRLLVEHGARPNVRDQYGETPLHRSIAEGYEENARLLLGLGADPEITDNKGRTPRALAVEYKEKKGYPGVLSDWLVSLFDENRLPE